MFDDKVLLITGGTGSFGSAVLKRFLRTNVREIRIFSRDEKKQEDLRLIFNDSKLKFYIGDVRDYDSVHKAMNEVDYVFHAAALKQVPSCEFYPMEAVKTNILGTENVIEAAIANTIKRVILLSTDKAVYPINAMGISKAMAERVVIARSRLLNNLGTVICITRYGNVMGSRGSVIPLFISQVKRKNPLTTTDKNMTRFLMSLEESVDLVLFAFSNGKQGDLFVQKAPAASIGNLAEAIKQIFKSNSEIHEIGTRHGEKLYESLISREEMAVAEDLGLYYRISADNRDLNYSPYFNKGRISINSQEDFTSHNTTQLTVSQVKDLLFNLEFVKEELNA